MIALVLLGLPWMQDPDFEALLKQLSHESIEVRERALSTLVALGDKAEARVKSHLASAQGEVKARCESVLHAIRVNRSQAAYLPALKRVTIDAKDAKLSEVLADLQKQSGLALITGKIPDSSVTVRVKEATPLEALDAVCKSADLGHAIEQNFRWVGPGRTPAYSVGGGPMEAGIMPIRLHPAAYANAPSVFVRQFSVAAVCLGSGRTTDFRKRLDVTGFLILRLSWTPGAYPETASLDVSSVNDDKGRPLYKRPPGTTTRVWGPPNHPLLGCMEDRVELAFPEEDARSISSIRGTARLSFEKAEKVLFIDNPEASVGQKRGDEGLTVQLTAFQVEKGSAQLTLAFTGTRANAVLERAVRPPDLTLVEKDRYCTLVRIKLEDGTFTGLVLRGGGPRTGALKLLWRRATAKISSIEIVTEWSFHNETFDFEFKDIPLPK